MHGSDRGASRIAAIAVGVVATALSIRLAVPYLAPGAYLPDYTVFWTAARMAAASPELLYDVQAVTRAQSWLTDPELGARPWAYPPSALLLFGPFALLPVWWSLLAWNLVSLAAFVAVASRFVRRWGLLLVLVSPPVVWCLLAGQTALMAGTAILGALLLLPTRPIVAGILLGLIAAVKPQLLLLAPVALAVGGHWRALAAAGVAGVLTGAASMLLLGWQPWLAWVRALGEFQAIIDAGRLHWLGLTPYSLAHVLGLARPLKLGFQLAGAALGLALVVHAFRMPDVRLRAAALIGGSLLGSSYAMPYELAMLAPVAAALLLSGPRWGLAATLALVGAVGLLPLLALLAAALMVAQEQAAGA